MLTMLLLYTIAMGNVWFGNWRFNHFLIFSVWFTAWISRQSCVKLNLFFIKKKTCAQLVRGLIYRYLVIYYFMKFLNKLDAFKNVFEPFYNDRRFETRDSARISCLT